MRQPDFNNLLAVLTRQKPSRPTLFEFFMNDPLYAKLAGPDISSRTDSMAIYRTVIHAFKNAGFDYATVPSGPDTLSFYCPPMARKDTLSMADGAVIFDQASFDAYQWKDPVPAAYAYLDSLAAEVPSGMKLIGIGPSGVFENATVLLGYENMCTLVYENEQLVSDVFEAVGTRFVEHFKIMSRCDAFGALLHSDDWGFKTQTMLPPEMMRKLVFPWHKNVVEVIHAAGKPAILHSCGQLQEVMDDIIDDMKYDAKHSFEDTIIPVEQAYDKWHNRIAILGGIDLDFLVRGRPEEIFERSVRMLEHAVDGGGYALGSGNSIPEYVPEENFRAMIRAANAL